MKLKEYIKKLQNIKPSLQDKKVVIECPNGLLVEPKTKIWIDYQEEGIEEKGTVIVP